MQYANWLNLDALLNLQTGVKAAWTAEGEEPTDFWLPGSISPHENMFIVVHQCFELWFKVILDQIDSVIPALLNGRVADATRLLRRAVGIMQLLVEQIRIPATMGPDNFMRFRNQRLERDGKALITGLSPASGTESYQFREIEIASGLRDDPVYVRYLGETEKLPVRLLTPRQATRMSEPTLPEAFLATVRRRGLELDGLFSPSGVLNPNSDLLGFADTCLEYDALFQQWRVNHVNMVQQMIGTRSGTGFLGPEYLEETAGIKIQEKNRVLEDRQVRPRFFKELSELRNRVKISQPQAVSHL